MIVPATLILTAAIFALDLMTPLAAGEWGLYLVPLLVSIRARQRSYPLWLAGVCTALLGIGFLYSRHGGIDPRLAAANRLLGIAIFWVTAALMVQRTQAEAGLREQERRLRAILDHSPFAIFTKDLSGRYLEFNRQSELYNQRSKESVLGKTDYEVFDHEYGDTSALTDQEVLTTGKSVSRERQIPQKNGMQTHLVVKFPLLDERGKCEAVCGIAADITDLKRAEQALRQNQERLELAQMVAKMGTFEWIVATGEVIWSQPLEAIYGLPAGGFRGTYEAWTKMVHPDDRARADVETVKALKDNVQLSHEFRIVWADGSIRWIKCMARCLYSESGAPLRMIGVNIDITEPRRVRHALAISNERLGLIARVTATVVGTASLAEHGKKLADQVRKAFGVDFCVIRILEGTDLVLLSTAGISESNLTPRIPIELGVSPEIMAQKRPIFVPDVRLHASSALCMQKLPQSDRYVSYAGAPLVAHNEIVGMLGIYSKPGLLGLSEKDLDHLQIVANQIGVAIMNDRLFKELNEQKNQLALQMSERKVAERGLKQSEERFRAISEQSLVGIYITQDDKIAYVNPTFAEIFGYAPEECLALPSVLDIIAEEDRPFARDNLKRRLAGELDGQRFQCYGRRKNGSPIRIETYGITTELEGRPAIIGVLHDITEREQNEAILKRTTEQLQTLSRRLLELQETERRHIARELHDEIGQALTALKINLQAVQRISGESSFAPRLVDSISIVDRTLRQVRNLSLDLRPSLLDDLGLYAALRWYADQQAQRSGLSIRFAATTESDARLESALETACFRVAQEALTNIVRHAKARNVRIELETAPNNFLHLVVSDDGVGFDRAGLHSHAERGANLGLLGMEERALLIGGRIEINSTPGQGTEVHAWLPLAHASSRDLADDHFVLQ